MPVLKLSRLRKNSNIRNWLSQTQLQIKDIILPYFVVEGKGKNEPIKSMPGIYHFSLDNLLKNLSKLKKIQSVLLFGLSKRKDKFGTEAYKKDGVVQRAIRTIKKEFKQLTVITDVCLCGYTSHGHCGIIERPDLPVSKAGVVDNEATIEVLAKIALSHAEAGADFVAPSAMMDCQVKAIRQALDNRGLNDTGILAYSAKYASNFYGPFREALNSPPRFGDRKAYQMDFRNSDEAMREIEQDINEGADIVMVKPALAYLDIICRARQKFNLPIAAYNVSAEFSMIKAYSQDPEVQKNLALETLIAIKRAGADFIITYWGEQLIKWIK